MTRDELAVMAAMKIGYTATRTGKTLDLFFKAAEQFLANGESVRLKNFGIFKTTRRRKRDKNKPPSHIRRVTFEASGVLADRIERA